MTRFHEFLTMGGYAVYVWPAYAIVIIVMIVNLVVAHRRHRRARRAVKHRAK